MKKRLIQPETQIAWGLLLERIIVLQYEVEVLYDSSHFITHNILKMCVLKGQDIIKL